MNNEMQSPTQTLPDGYFQTHEIDLAKNKGLAIGLNLVGLVIVYITFVLLANLANWVRPAQLSSTFTFRLDLTIVAQLLTLLVLVALNLVLHELIHGFFFWRFTGRRPVYALHLAYAYAAAPDWFIPFHQYWIIGLAPLAIIDVAGLLLIGLSPASWVWAIVLLVAFNTGGAIGDIWIIARLFRSARDCLVKDSGDAVRFFERRKPPAI